MRTIAKAASLVGVFFILSRILGVVRDVVIAGYFEAVERDAFFAAFGVPDFIFYVISGGALGSAFIPTFTRYLTREDHAGAWRLASAILNWLLLIVTTLTLLVAVAAPWLVQQVVAPGFPSEMQELTTFLMRWLLISTVIFGASGLLMGVLQARQHFFFPALAPVVYNLAIIGGAVLLGPWLGVQGLVIGVVVGALGHLVVQLPALRQFQPRYTLSLAPRDPGVRTVARLMAPRMLGLAAIQFNFVWDKILASWLPAGSITALTFGWRIMLLPQGIIAQAVAAAAFPTFSALAAREAWSELQETLLTTLRGILYLTIPATVGLILLGQPIIQLFFERGSFSPFDTRLTVWALGFYSLGLVAHSMVEIVTRVFYALNNTRTPVLVGLTAMGLNMLLSWLLMGWFAGWSLPPHAGIALASSLAIGLEMVWLFRLLPRLPGSLRVVGLVDPGSRMILAAGGMGLALWGLMTQIGEASPWLITPLGIALGGGVYGGLTLALGLPEPRLLHQQILRKLSR